LITFFELKHHQLDHFFFEAINWITLNNIKPVFHKTETTIDCCPQNIRKNSNKLTSGINVVGHPSFEEDWFEFGTGSVYAGGVGGGTTSDDAEFRFNVSHGGSG
jgi:hypothetical protein